MPNSLRLLDRKQSNLTKLIQLNKQSNLEEAKKVKKQKGQLNALKKIEQTKKAFTTERVMMNN